MYKCVRKWRADMLIVYLWFSRRSHVHTLAKTGQMVVINNRPVLLPPASLGLAVNSWAGGIPSWLGSWFLVQLFTTHTHLANKDQICIATTEASRSQQTNTSRTANRINLRPQQLNSQIRTLGRSKNAPTYTLISLKDTMAHTPANGGIHRPKRSASAQTS